MRQSLVAMVTIAALAFVGCGGGDGSTSTTAGADSNSPGSASKVTTTGTGGGGSGGPADEKAHRIPYAEVAGIVLTSNDPALVCGRYVTQRYLRVAYGGHQGCVDAQAPGSAANSVRSPHGRIGSAGTARLIEVPSGGPYDGERVEVSLVLDDGIWKVDALKANVPVGP